MHGMLVPSRHRIQRQSLFQLDNLMVNNAKPQPDNRFFSPYCSVESLTTSSNSSGKRVPRDKNYNISIFRGLKNSGEKPLADDVKYTRRECQSIFNEMEQTEERRQTITDAIATLDQLALFLTPAECDDDLFFITEYQAFVCWVYTQIRFGNFSTNMAKHFMDVKNRHRTLFECLKPKRFRLQRLLCILRFSQICLQYAEVCDDESVQWCKKAMDEANGHKKMTGRPGSRNEGSSDMHQKREERRISEIGGLLSSNIVQIELTWTHRMQTLHSVKQEKLV